MKKICPILLAILLCFAVSATSVSAATVTLSKLEIQHGEIFEIFGNDFGATAGTHSYVCFSSTSACVRGTEISARSEFEWSNTRIRMILPSAGIPISGNLTVYSEEGGLSVERGNASYLIRPKISQVVPASVVKPNQRVTISGNGFGDMTGEIFFAGIQGQVEAWSYTSITAVVPSNITRTGRDILVKTSNGTSHTTPLIIGVALTNDELSYRQYYLDQINIPALWERTAVKDVVVAVLDDGVYHNHPDLSERLWKNTNEVPGNGVDDDKNGYIDDHLGYNFWDNSPAVDPKGGHGTGVAGIIAANRNNTIGIAGIASRVQIMPIIVSDGSAVRLEAIRRGVAYAIDNGADIINISASSIGTTGFSDSLTEIFQFAFDSGVLVVVAAGNSDVLGGIGQNLNTIPASPVCNNGGKRIVLGVAALNNEDAVSDGRVRASWSSYGNNCVNISAPGVRITSTVPPAFQENQQFYTTVSGTSFASPIVSGIAAALKSIHPEFTPLDLINRIIAGKENIDPFNSGVEGQLGGRINAENLLSESLGTPKHIDLLQNEVRAGETLRFSIDHFLSFYTIRISDLVTFDAGIPKENIRVLAADMLEITIPNTLPAGSYRLRVVGQTGELKVSEEKFSVLPPLSITPPATQPTQTPTMPLSPIPLPLPSPTPSLRPTPLIGAPKPELIQRLMGLILLQVESLGEAWYLSPVTRTRYFLGRPADAFAIMRTLGLGVKHELITQTVTYPDRLLGRILLDVESHGEAYYIYPIDRQAYYLGRPTDAFEIMRTLGLGIRNKDLTGIPAVD